MKNVQGPFASPVIIFLACLISLSSNAQGLTYPAINWSGTIFDEYEHAIGWISKQGVVQNASNDLIAVIDKAGNAYDANGERIGKMTNDTFTNPHGSVLFKLKETAKDKPLELVNPQGKIIGLVDPRYKNQAVAIQCLAAQGRKR